MEADAQAAESKVDKSYTKEEALGHAIHAAELYIKVTKLASTDAERSRLRGKCKQLLSRAEEIKHSAQWVPIPKAEVLLRAPVSVRQLSKMEEVILLEGSKLHGSIFPPWTSEPDESWFDGSREHTAIYTEPADLKLSVSQRTIFGGWKRPHEIFHGVNDDASTSSDNQIDLVQDVTTDCSVVASLCAAVARVRNGHEKLLGAVMYPYDRQKSRPRVSKTGKYVFRLHFNGCFRKVVIDDRLPASNTSRHLHVVDRMNPKLLWPALIEKAYLKVRGGYDFPGSNSGTDLWVLSGWIPEQIFLQSDELQPELLWQRILKSFGYGDVMITLGTGKLSHKEEKQLGLAGEHDYAILDMIEVGLQRLLLVKNPWCDGMVWKGSVVVSEEDSSGESWTQGLRDALPEQGATKPGTFWMNMEAVIQHFESLYLNWNPGLFKYRQDHHFSWTIPTMDNPGSFTHNPQFSLKPSKAGTVWVLLSRHFATAEHDIAQNKPTTLSNSSSALGFISLYVFSSTSGQRVYLSNDAFHRGAFVDSPQTLARLEVSPAETYTVVSAQQGLPLPKYSFSLFFFSRNPLTVTTARDSLPHFSTHNGSWSRHTAGGNASAPSYPVNPQFSINIPSPSSITIILECNDSELPVHVELVYSSGQRVTNITAKDILLSSGDYRRGCALASLPQVDTGAYTIVCSTFSAGQTGSFTLRVGSSVPCTVLPIPAETAGRISTRLPILVFPDGVDRILSPLTLSRLTKLRVVARAAGKSRPLLKVSVERGQGPNKDVLIESCEGEFSDAPMGIRSTDVDLHSGMCAQGGVWVVVERLGGRNGIDEVEVEILSDSAVSVGRWTYG